MRLEGGRVMIERPDRLAIVALGPSSHDYIVDCERNGGRRALFDQTWVVNTYAGVLDHDVVLHMDDLKLQEARGAAGNTKIAALCEQLKRHDRPIVTSTTYPDYPTSVAFPLEAALNTFDTIQAWDGTLDYAMALALMLGTPEISLYGCDFNWRGASEIEPGRSSLSYWIGRAQERGCTVKIPPTSTLMNASGKPGPRFYGYDAEDMRVEIIDGRAIVKRTPKPMPTAGEIESRYDHSQRERAAA
jgi:hypothetical protein